MALGAVGSRVGAAPPRRAHVARRPPGGRRARRRTPPPGASPPGARRRRLGRPRARARGVRRHDAVRTHARPPSGLRWHPRRGPPRGGGLAHARRARRLRVRGAHPPSTRRASPSSRGARRHDHPRRARGSGVHRSGVHERRDARRVPGARRSSTRTRRRAADDAAAHTAVRVGDRRVAPHAVRHDRLAPARSTATRATSRPATRKTSRCSTRSPPPRRSHGCARSVCATWCCTSVSGNTSRNSSPTSWRHCRPARPLVRTATPGSSTCMRSPTTRPGPRGPDGRGA